MHSRKIRKKSQHWASAACALALGLVPRAGLAETPESEVEAKSEASSAPNIERARLHFKRGVELHQKGNLEAAYAEFLRAQEAAPHYQVSFNIAQTAFALGYYGDAQREFELYLASGGENIGDERRQEVEEKLRRLQELVAVIEVDCREAGASVLVDGRLLGVCPLHQSITVAAGRHSVSAEGKVARQRTIDLAAEQRVVVSFGEVGERSRRGADRTRVAETKNDADSTNGAGARPDVSSGMLGQGTSGSNSPALSERETGPSGRFWWGLAATSALGLGAATMGILALKQSSQAGEAAVEIPVDPEKIEAANQRASAFALSSDLLLGATIISASATLIFAWPFGSRSELTRSSESNGLELAVGVRSINLSGRF